MIYDAVSSVLCGLFFFVLCSTLHREEKEKSAWQLTESSETTCDKGAVQLSVFFKWNFCVCVRESPCWPYFLFLWKVNGQTYISNFHSLYPCFSVSPPHIHWPPVWASHWLLGYNPLSLLTACMTVETITPHTYIIPTKAIDHTVVPKITNVKGKKFQIGGCL